jgi:anti-sigma factor RsiW
MRFRRGLPAPLPPEPDCGQVAAVLQAYLDGELAAADTDAVAGHLEHCQRCNIEARTVAQVIDAIQRQRPDLDRASLDRLAGVVDGLTRDGPSA